MKRISILFATAALMCASCGEDIESKAKVLLDEARVASEAKEFSKARLLLDSLKNTYPKAFKARREAIKLSRDVEYGEQTRSITYYDEQLKQLTEQRDKLLADFVLEKDTRYQEEGYYMLPSQTLKNNYGLTYLRAQVSEKGDAMITSVYRGNKAIEHKSVKLSAGDIFVECNAPLHKYNSKHLGVYSERLDFRYGQDGGIMDFILSATGEVKVELSGRSKIEYILRKSDAEAVEKVLELAQVLQNIESLQAMRAEASRHIEFIERNRERFEVEEKVAE